MEANLFSFHLRLLGPAKILPPPLTCCGVAAEDGLAPGEEGAEGEVRLPGHQVGGGLAHHPPA